MSFGKFSINQSNVDKSAQNLKKRVPAHMKSAVFALIALTVLSQASKIRMDGGTDMIKAREPVLMEFPLRGEWLSPNTPGTKIPSHGTNRLGTGYAYDFIHVDWERQSRPARAAQGYGILFEHPINETPALQRRLCPFPVLSDGAAPPCQRRRIPMPDKPAQAWGPLTPAVPRDVCPWCISLISL